MLRQKDMMGCRRNQMSFNVLTWNIRGVSSEAKVRALRRNIRKFKPLFVVIQEIKCSELSNKLADFIWGRSCKQWEVLPASGSAGGIAILWDSNRVHVEESIMGEFSVSLKCKLRGKDDCWVFTGIYGPTIQHEKEKFWEELDSIGAYWNLPWLLAGDLNAVRSRNERSSGRASRYERDNFQKFIDAHGLLEFDRVGAKFTFNNGQVNPVQSRLDRFLSNAQWIELFGDHLERTMGFYQSDHRMCLLVGLDECREPKAFRFKLFWLDDETLVQKMNNWWQSMEVTGKPGFVLNKKLKLLT